MFGRRHRPTAEPQSGRLLVHALPTCVTLLLGYWQELFDENSVDGAVYGVGKATYKLGNLVRQEQTGQLQRYALTLVVGLILLVFATALLDPEFVLRHLIPSLGSGPKLPGGQP